MLESHLGAWKSEKDLNSWRAVCKSPKKITPRGMVVASKDRLCFLTLGLERQGKFANVTHVDSACAIPRDVASISVSVIRWVSVCNLRRQRAAGSSKWSIQDRVFERPA